MRYYRELNVRFTHVLGGNGACYRLRAFARLLQRIKRRHERTRSRMPRTTARLNASSRALREWAYARRYDNSNQRAAHLNPWLRDY